jgi:hypothetical protein
MKKKLLMGTVLALTLGVSSCGMFGGGDDTSSSSASSSSSVSSSTTQSSSSTFANLTSLNIAAPTNLLTQTVGSLSKVAFAATTNAGANPSIVEWFVNDVKTTVKGLNFEFTPNAAGNFKVEAKSGNVVSNSLSIVASGTTGTGFTIESATVVDLNTLEVKAPGGALVSVTGKTLAATSKYDLARGVYVVDLTANLTQGEIVTVSLTRDGVTRTQAVTFDTRVLDVAHLKTAGGVEVKVGTDGIYKIEKPHVLNTSGVLNTVTTTYVVTFESENFPDSVLTFKKENSLVPTGATALTTVESSRTVAAVESNAGTIEFTLSKDSVVGVYEYKYTLAGISKSVKVNVVAPEAKFEFIQHGASAATVDSYTTLAVAKDAATGKAIETDAKYDVVYTQNGGSIFGVAKNSDGSYTIEKDYLAKFDVFKTVNFGFETSNFTVPSNLLDQNSSNPNQVILTMNGPSGIQTMPVTYTGSNFNIAPQYSTLFRSKYPTAVSLTQYIDASTTVGSYVYTFDVRQSGLSVYTKTVTIKVVAPTSNLKLEGTVLDSNENDAKGWVLLETVRVGTLGGTDPVASATPATGTYFLNNTATPLVLKQNLGTPAAPNWVAVTPIPTYFYSTTSTATLYKYSGTDWVAVTAGTAAEEITVAATNSGTTVNALWLDSDDNKLYKYINTPKSVEAKVSASNVFEIQKPKTAGLDSKFVSFNLIVENFESTANLTGTATLQNSFTGSSKVVTSGGAQAQSIKELLPFNIAYTGPMTLSGYNTNSRVGIELGVASSVGGTDANTTYTLNDNEIIKVLDRQTSNAVRYPYYSDATGSSVTMNAVINLEVNYLTLPGDYTFNITVGSLTKQVIVKVVAPVEKVDFKVLTNATNTVDNDFKFVLKDDGKYYATLPSVGGNVPARISLLLENMEKDNSGNVVYTLSQASPSTASSTSNVAKAFDVPGNDGKLVSLTVLDLLGGTRTAFTTTTSGSDITGVTAVGYQLLTLTEAGEYVFTATVNGKTTVLTLVVLPVPSLEIQSVLVGTSELTKFKFGSTETHLINSATVTSLNLVAKGLNLPEEVYYTISSSTGVTEVTAKTLLVFKNGVVEIPVAITAPSGATTYTVTVVLYDKDKTTVLNSTGLVVTLRANPA